MAEQGAEGRDEIVVDGGERERSSQKTTILFSVEKR